MPPILYDSFHWSSGIGPSDPRTVVTLMWIMFGAGAIVTGFFLIRRLAGRSGTAAPRALAEAAVIAGVISVAILVWTGRLSNVWLLYISPLPMVAIGYMAWERFGLGHGARKSKSRIGTLYLKMVLDHDASLFDGKVIKGVYRGTVLSAMTLEELRLLQVEVSSDPDSVNVLNAYLDHVHAGARRDGAAGAGADADADADANGNDRQAHRRTNGAMSEEEARNLLGLPKGASAVDIKASHRRLIKQVHPDHGGTDYLAHKINEAKNLLLNL